MSKIFGKKAMRRLYRERYKAAFGVDPIPRFISNTNIGKLPSISVSNKISNQKGAFGSKRHIEGAVFVTYSLSNHARHVEHKKEIALFRANLNR